MGELVNIGEVKADIESKKSLPFDKYRDLNALDRKRMREKIDFYAKEQKWSNFLTLAGSFVTLYPELRDIYRPIVPQQWMHDEQKRKSMHTFYTDFERIQDFLTLQRLFPNNSFEFCLKDGSTEFVLNKNIDRSTRTRMNNQLSTYQRINAWVNYVQYGRMMTEMGMDVPINPEIRRELRSILNKMIDSQDWPWTSQFAVNWHIIEEGIKNKRLESVVDKVLEYRPPALPIKKTFRKVYSILGHNKNKIPYLEDIKQIMGNDFLGPEEVGQAFGEGISDKYARQRPSMSTELKRLKSGRYLIYFTDKLADGTPITMQYIVEKLKRQQKGFINELWRTTVSSDDRKKERFYEVDTPKPGYKLVTVNDIPGSFDKDALAQTAAKIEFLKENDFRNGNYPDEYRAAFDQFEEQRGLLQELMQNNWMEAARRINELAINRLTGLTPVEEAYLYLVVSARADSQQEREKYSRTNTLVSWGGTVIVRIGGAQQADIKSFRADDILAVAPFRKYPILGTKVARS